MTGPSASGIIEMLADEGSWTSWDTVLPEVAVDAEYADQLSRARAKTGLDESVRTGAISIHGHRVAIVVCEFAFLGGSIGIAAGHRITTGIRRATSQGLPLLVLPTSGGTRMQEGTTAFLQMVRITAAVTDHKAAALPYLVYLRHPTTGGVFASWASLGHLTMAEPGALIGFLGPRVYEALHGRPFPSDVQTAENLYRCGLVDGVCPADRLADIVADTLSIISGPTAHNQMMPVGDRRPERPEQQTWASVLASRRPERPGVRELLTAATQIVQLHGTGHGEADPAIIVALVRFCDVSCVLIGQDRWAQARAPLGPAALRQAQRGIRLAAELDLPLVSVIDTPGAELSQQAEEGGIAGEIATCIAEMVALEVPTVSVLLGPGTGGAALALFPADRILGASHGWLSPLPPEGASAILHHTTRCAPQMAAQQGIGAAELLAAGAIDRIIAENPDASEEPEQFCARVVQAVRDELATLAPLDSATRVPRRIQRFDKLTMRTRPVPVPA